MSEDLGRCDGEVLFGFCIQACSRPATRVLRNSAHEVYHFCERHYRKAIKAQTIAASFDFGEYPDYGPPLASDDGIED